MTTLNIVKILNIFLLSALVFTGCSKRGNDNPSAEKPNAEVAEQAALAIKSVYFSSLIESDVDSSSLDTKNIVNPEVSAQSLKIYNAIKQNFNCRVNKSSPVSSAVVVNNNGGSSSQLNYNHFFEALNLNQNSLCPMTMTISNSIKSIGQQQNQQLTIKFEIPTLSTLNDLSALRGFLSGTTTSTKNSLTQAEVSSGEIKGFVDLKNHGRIVITSKVTSNVSGESYYGGTGTKTLTRVFENLQQSYTLTFIKTTTLDKSKTTDSYSLNNVPISKEEFDKSDLGYIEL